MPIDAVAGAFLLAVFNHLGYGARGLTRGLISAFNDATIDAHRVRMGELVEASQAILNAADAEKRDLSVEERTIITNSNAEVERLDTEVGLRQRVIDHATALATRPGRATQPDASGVEQDPDPVAPAARPTASAPRPGAVPAAPRQANGNFGFRSFGDFASSVRHASARGGNIDARLIKNAAPTTLSSEAIGADGGFLVPPDFRAALMQRVFGEDSLLSRCDVQQTSSNTFTMPVDETTPWGGSGIRAYWLGEAAQYTASKPQLREASVRLHKLGCFVPVTEEQLEDAPQLDGYLNSKAPEVMDWEISYAVMWGSGVGQPLGIMASPALISQAAEGAQTADTINATNCVKMLSRLHTNSRRNAVWIIHPDAEPQLPLMTLGNQPVYLPPGGLAGNSLGTLLGRPVIPHQVAKTVGDLGDFTLVDFSQYLAARRASGIRTQMSIHLWFDYDIMAFKFTLRLGGTPWWSAAQSPKHGSSTVSPFVTLAAR